MTQLVLPPKPYHGPGPSSRPPFNPHGHGPAQDGVPFDVPLLLRTVRRRWWIVALSLAAAVVAALYWARQQTPVYVASAIVQVVPSTRVNLTEGITKTDAGASDPMFGQLALPQLEIVRSRNMAGAVVDSEPLGLRVVARGFPHAVLRDVAVAPDAPAQQLPVVFTDAGVRVGGGTLVPYGLPATVGPLRITVDRRPTTSEAAGSEGTSIMVLPRELAIAQFSATIQGRARERSTLIDLTYTSPDPELAQRVVNRAAHVFQAVSAQSAQQQARRRREFIGEQLARVDSQAQAADFALSGFRSSQQAFSSADKFSGQQKDLLDLQLRIRELRSSRDMAQAVLQGFQGGTAADRANGARLLVSAPGFERNPIVTRLADKLAGYEASRAELTSGQRGLTGQHPEVARLDSLVHLAQSGLQAAVRAQVEVLDAQLRTLEGQRAAREREMRGLPLANARENQLTQNVSVLRDQATVLRGEFQRARIAEAVAVGPIEILDLGTHPRAAALGRSRVVVTAMLLALTFGFAAAGAPALFDRGLRRRVDVEAALGLPVLATVPRLTPPSAGVLVGITGRLAAWRDSGRAAPVRRSTEPPRAAGAAVALATLDVRQHPGAEAYRQLRATMFSTRHGQAPRRVLVTSALPSEGKTSVAVNLAATLAQQGGRVLLVDGDLRSAKLHRLLDVAPAPGLSDVLVGCEAPSEVIQRSAVGGLFVLTAGSEAPRASDQLGGLRLRAMLNDLGQHFDAVVIDAPPVLAVSDAAVLGAASDAVLVVVRAGQTTAGQAAEAVRHLANSGSRLAGVVFNDPDSEAHEDTHRAYYSYYYAGA